MSSLRTFVADRASDCESEVALMLAVVCTGLLPHFSNGSN